MEIYKYGKKRLRNSLSNRSMIWIREYIFYRNDFVRNVIMNPFFSYLNISRICLINSYPPGEGMNKRRKNENSY